MGISKTTYFHSAPILLGVDSTILPGNFYRIRSKFETDWARRHMEKVFEDVRLRQFHHLPSRQNCVFLCESEEAARRFANSNHRFQDVLYEVALTEPTVKIHRADYNLVRPQDGPTAYEELARQYWSSEQPGDTEVLVDCSVKIVRYIGPIVE